MKYGCILVSFLSLSLSKAQVKIDSPIAKYEDIDQLNTLYKQYGTLIIAEDYIFQMPCDCYCRNISGNKEDRNLGGNTENRNLAGNKEDRNLGGNIENRNLGGNSENRNMGGDTENRNLAGNTENRNLSGNTENRNFGGNSENRNLAGNTENRNIGGNTEDRNAGGQISSFSCFKNKLGDFFFSGINPNTKLFLFDGVYPEEIPFDKIKKHK